MAGILRGVTWFKQAAIRVRSGGRVLYVDPWGVPAGEVADYVLLTHPHYDHFSEGDIARIRGPRTQMIEPASMRKQFEDADHFLRPGDLLQLDGLDVLAVPAYNVAKRFHPRESGWLGYIFTLGDVTYYHAGDTDFLESMNEIRCDVAFLPCGGHYTMGPEEAAQAAVACDAKVVVPIHWGAVVGSLKDAERLAALLDAEVRILERGEEV
ncbi:MAG: MBL fold metallo-hydrolase [Gemmatimonadetes bacterium]|nr:MBL fold metallo-hydrolase [Gemmatimonadota bacterium]